MLYAIVAFVGTLCLIFLLRKHAHGFGLVDKPSPRKTHLGEIPVIGGLAIGVSFLLTALTQYPVEPDVLVLIICCLVILLTGLFDDMHEFSARSKFVGQVVAAVLMTSWANLYITDLGNLWGTGEVVLQNWGIPFTLFCVIGLINAMNMIDGLDGLGGGIAAVAAVWLGVAAQIEHPFKDAALLFILAAAVAGFLVFNLRHPWRRHASVFLGDAGSMFLGFVLVWFAVDVTQGGSSDFYPISTVWILGVPIIDTVYLMVRRILMGQNPFAPDRRHIHHTLIFMGLSQSRTLWLLLGKSALFGAIGFFGWFYEVPEYVLAYGFLATFAVHCVFMQHWREILRFFGFKHQQLAHGRQAAATGTSKATAGE
jgi:UDP-GlcNAc:undecaprenyl-phosphate GlcNAc-1-phosphate transferase